MKTQNIFSFLALALFVSNTFAATHKYAKVAAAVPTAPPATLRVSGTPHASQIYQQVKAVSCVEPKKNAQQILQPNCKSPIYFDLNSDQSLPPGDYILGFSDTVYPGFVHLNSGDQIEIKLQSLPLPQAEATDTVRAYINFDSLMEQKKIYFSVYYTSEHFFKMTEYNFDDLFLTTTDGKNIFSPFDQRSCGKIQSDSGASDFAKILCANYKNATSMMDMADFFLFETKPQFEAQYQEAFIWSPGDIFSVRYKRNLVALPINGAAIVTGDSLAVFQGSYKVQVIKRDGTALPGVVENTADTTEKYTDAQLNRSMKNRPSAASTGDATEGGASTAADDSSSSSAPSFFINSSTTTASSNNNASNTTEDMVTYQKNCFKAYMWKTENRSYCTKDSAEGCNRRQAKLCEPTNIIDFRFRTN